MYKILTALITALLLAGCSPKTVTGVADDTRLDQLQEAMTGSFSSATQASLDDSYYDIDLHMAPIWEDKGRYLYVEQAVATSPEAPYRQRVYQLERRGKKLISKVFELPDPDRFVGAYGDPNKLALISPADLIERVGCAVILKMESPGLYRGNTRKKSCKSTLRGAEYATSRVTVTNSFIQSWDRGFNEEDEQVWGATEGGYMFLKE